MDYKSYLGMLTIAMAIVSYGLYFRNIFRHKTKPHGITWLVWSVLSGVTFLTQRTNGAGAGGWITGFSAFAALLIFILSIHFGEKKIRTMDWYCVVGALVSLSFWYLDQGGLRAVIFASITFTIGFIPTFRKGYLRPSEETAATYALNGFKFLLAIIALDALNPLTAVYPAVIVLLNFAFVVLLMARRLKLRIFSDISHHKGFGYKGY